MLQGVTIAISSQVNQDEGMILLLLAVLPHIPDSRNEEGVMRQVECVAWDGGDVQELHQIQDLGRTGPREENRMIPTNFKLPQGICPLQGWEVHDVLCMAFIG